VSVGLGNRETFGVEEVSMPGKTGKKSRCQGRQGRSLNTREDREEARPEKRAEDVGHEGEDKVWGRNLDTRETFGVKVKVESAKESRIRAAQAVNMPCLYGRDSPGMDVSNTALADRDAISASAAVQPQQPWLTSRTGRVRLLVGLVGVVVGTRKVNWMLTCGR
jgi:hypothetical protein